jgi:hypothetical protein
MTLRHLAAEWHGNHFPCLVSPQRTFTTAAPVEPERFTALVIAQLLRAVPDAGAFAATITRTIAGDLAGTDRVHFFRDPARLPPDADCTAVAYLSMLGAGLDVEQAAHRALDLIAATTDADGVVTTYFETSGDRAGIVDAVVCANVMRLATRLGRGSDVLPTWRFLRRVIAERSYLDGTRYYPSPDSLLYALALGKPFPELRDAVIARIGATDHVLDLAQRVLAAARLDIDATRDRELLEARRAEGGWAPEGWFCYGRSRTWFGSRALTTAFALAALEAA